jgi:hypothetical protein
MFKNLQEYIIENMLTKFNCSSAMFHIFIYLHCPYLCMVLFNDGVCSTESVALYDMVIN